MNKQLIALGIIALIIVPTFLSISSLSLVEDTEKPFENQNINSEKWALIVAPPNFEDMGWFVPEGRSLLNILISSGWKKENIISLFYENATKENLINAINQIAENDDSSDTV